MLDWLEILFYIFIMFLKFDLIFGCAGSLLLHTFFSLVAESRGCSCGSRFLIVEVSLIEQHGF